MLAGATGANALMWLSCGRSECSDVSELCCVGRSCRSECSDMNELCCVGRGYRSECSDVADLWQGHHRDLGRCALCHDIVWLVACNVMLCP